MNPLFLITAWSNIKDFFKTAKDFCVKYWKLLVAGALVVVGYVLGRRNDTTAVDRVDAEALSDAAKKQRDDALSLTKDHLDSREELLDDYEEGTFLPLCNFTSATPSSGRTQGFGQYTKIGRQVHCHLSLTNINVSGASGDIQIQNMPFTSLADSGDGAVSNTIGVAKANFINFAASTFLNSQIADNTSNCKITECTDNTTADTITASNCTDGVTDITVSISYTTAS